MKQEWSSDGREILNSKKKVRGKELRIGLSGFDGLLDVYSLNNVVFWLAFCRFFRLV